MANQLVFCRVAHSPLRKEASDTSEMVSEILFGEVAKVIAIDNNWLHIQSLEDNYEGYSDIKHFIDIDDSIFNDWKNNRYRIEAPAKVQSPRGIIHLPIGSFVNYEKRFNINQTLYLLEEKNENIYNWKQFSLQFLNTTYLWGGRTECGIDCSGFTQQVLRYRKVELPRDASMQVELGELVEFNQREIGDLLFFKNKQDKITHVGILFEMDKIIHASGFVKIDDFNEQGIINIENGEISHDLHVIKRMI